MCVTEFAFRMFVSEILCPSAMSIFDFMKVFPEAFEQCGYGDSPPEQAAGGYERAAEALKPVWQAFDGKALPDGVTMRTTAEQLRLAKPAEKEAVGHVKVYPGR